MNPKFIVSHLDQQLGPFGESELKAKWEKGELFPIDYVYVEGKQDWILLSEHFAWAKTAPGSATPPPLNAAAQKKTLPPEPPPEEERSLTLAPLPLAAVKPQPTPEAQLKKPVPTGTKVELKGGVGEVDLSPLEPGEVELVLQSSAGVDLKLHSPLKIQVKPSEPQRVEWNCPTQQTVGVDAEIVIQVLDQSGHLCTHYSDRFAFRMHGAASEEIPVQINAGKASFRVSHTKAENCRLTLTYSGAKSLKLPEAQTLEWHPGAASKLILDGPQEYIAGHPMKVHVKAVDNYGNLAKTFHGTIVLEVKAS